MEDLPIIPNIQGKFLVPATLPHPRNFAMIHPKCTIVQIGIFVVPTPITAGKKDVLGSPQVILIWFLNPEIVLTLNVMVVDHESMNVLALNRGCSMRKTPSREAWKS